MKRLKTLARVKTFLELIVNTDTHKLYVYTDGYIHSSILDREYKYFQIEVNTFLKVIEFVYCMINHIILL